MKGFRRLDGIITFCFISTWGCFGYFAFSLHSKIDQLNANILELKSSISEKLLEQSERFQDKLDKLDLKNRKLAYNLRTKRSKNTNKFIIYASPMKLTNEGVEFLRKNGFISFINKRYNLLSDKLKKISESKNKFKIEGAILNIFFIMEYENSDELDNLAYNQGLQPDDIKGYMSIYFRDKYFKTLNL